MPRTVCVCCGCLLPAASRARSERPLRAPAAGFDYDTTTDFGRDEDSVLEEVLRRSREEV